MRRRPGRVLLAFLLVVASLYAMAALGGTWKPKLGLDLQGGTRIALQAIQEGGDQPTPEKLAEARDIIEQRVNGSGVSEAEVTTQGGDQIIVEVPGQQSQDLVDQVGRTAQLRFRLVWATTGGTAAPTPQVPLAPPTGSGAGNSGEGNGGAGNSNGAGNGGAGNNNGAGNGGAGNNVGNSLTGGNGNTIGGGLGNNIGTSVRSPGVTAGAVANPRTVPQADGDGTGDQGDGQGSGQGGDQGTGQGDGQGSGQQEPDWSQLVLEQMLAVALGQPAPDAYADALAQLRDQVQSFQCPDPQGGAAQVVDDASRPLITCDSDGQAYLLSPAIIEGTQLDDANAVPPSQSLEWVVALDFDSAASETFATATRALAGQQVPFAIVLDGQVLSAPVVIDPILDGNSQISGGSPPFTQATATELANQLKYGALPLSFGINGVSVEGPTLAGSQLDAGLLAGAFGLGLVLAYALLYYRGLGLVIMASLLIAAAIVYPLTLLLGQSVGFTLTLPGIAGLIVAIGITADSFIVYFERLRDEVRDGRSLRVAVENGWRRARLTILAADAVSFLAALVLYVFAIGVVQGFAFALGLTTVVDVFLVFFFTKPMVTLLARTRFFGQGHKLSGLDAAHLGISGRSVSQMARAPRPAASGGVR